jgi:hypothetical protein
VSFSDGNFSSIDKLATKSGLQFITTSPTEAYWLSSFDDSLWVFGGGRTVEKQQRFERFPGITNGAWSTKENSLLLQNSTDFIWIRDGIITSNTKAVDQTNLRLYETTDGIVIGNNTSNWRYTFLDQGSSTVVPFDFRTGFFGLQANEKSIFTELTVTIYSPTKESLDATITLYSFDDSDKSFVQERNFSVVPSNYNTEGYARLRVIPKYDKSLGTSIRFYTTAKVYLVSMAVKFADNTAGLVKNSK